MLISDSMPLLWLSYMALSLVVLVAGYLGIRWLPRLPRFVLTGVVAGLVWMPAGFTLSRMKGEAPYEGRAPAVMVSAIAFLQDDVGKLSKVGVLLLLGVGLGAAVGVLLWSWLRRRRVASGEADAGQGRATGDHSRREPVLD
jgi:hypothetical protein